MFHRARKKLAEASHGATEEVVMIGDTMETDIRGAVESGMLSYLVLSGSTIDSKSPLLPRLDAVNLRRESDPLHENQDAGDVGHRGGRYDPAYLPGVQSRGAGG